MKTIRLGVYLPVLAVLLCLCVVAARGQTTGFTYQGRLTDGGTPANGDFGFVFRLFSTSVGDTQIGQDVNIPVVTVENGIFTVTLDFGANAFPGADRFLEIIVYHTNASGIPVILSPRQKLTSTPYAIRALSATTADTATNATQLGGTAANQFVLTGDARLSDARTPTPGSNSYIQNGTAPQAGSNFNISGDGSIGGNLTVGGSFTLNTVNATTQYNLGGARVLSNGGTNNFFAGQGAGQSITTGDSNSFFGPSAGQNTADGRQNAFFGRNAGQLNTSGSFNAFFGAGAGLSNVGGNNNAFFGFTAGRSNDTGFNNSFFGNAAGFATTGGGNNSFFGFFAGNLNTTGTGNNFFGASAGSINTTGFSNTFVGNGAGKANTTGNSNTLVGDSANVASGNLFNASAVGAAAFVSQPNSLVLGSINGVNGATADTNVGIGTTSPRAKLHIVGDPNFGTPLLQVESTSSSGTGVSFDKNTSFFIDGVNFGVNVAGGRFGVAQDGRVLIGLNGIQPVSQARFQIFDNSGSIHFGGAGCATGFTGLGFASTLSCTNFSLLGNGTHTIVNRPSGGGIFFREANADEMIIATGGNVGIGTNAPTTRLHIFSAQNPGFQVETGDSSFAETQYKAGNYVWRTGVGGASVLNGAANKYYIYDINAGQFRMAIDTAGNVGFGTTSPTAKLHVAGDGLFTGNLTVNGNLNANISLSTVNAVTEYDLGGTRIIGGNGDSQVGNFFAGFRSGQSLSNGTYNSFFGIEAGKATDSGARNSFFGYQAGMSNTGGHDNSYFGYTAGLRCKGSGNSFFGQGTGLGSGSPPPNDCTGSNNSFFGQNAGTSLTNGNQNTAVGQGAGSGLNSGSNNSFLGFGAGSSTSAGSNNVFVGQSSGGFNTSGSENTAIGSNAWMGAANLTNATAIGANSCVTASDSLVLGGITNCGNPGGRDTKVGIGTSAPTARLHVNGDTLITGNLTVNGTINATVTGNFIQNTTTQQASANFNISGDGTAGGTLSGNIVTAGTQFNIGSLRVLSTAGSASNTFVGVGAGEAGFGLTPSADNTLIGFSTGRRLDTNSTNNTFIGSGADVVNVLSMGADNSTLIGANTKASVHLTNATAIGANAFVNKSNSMVLGSINGSGTGTVDTNVGIGTPTPNYKLEIVDSSITGLRVQNNTAGGTVGSFGSNGAFQVDAANNPGGRLQINENGNVGIGTTAPQDKLHVNGNVRVTNGGIYVTNPNTLVITSPDGHCWGITVNNSGVLSTFPVTCPP